MLHTTQRHYRSDQRATTDLKPPERNNYFYGKLLDVFHLEMEQDYFNAKRRLLNRLVTGPGVVCGLGVELAEMPDGSAGVLVLPGLAIDRCGREIIVAAPSQPQPLPEFPEYVARPPERKGGKQADSHEEYRSHYCPTPYAHVVLCYHECEIDPSPAMAGDCETTTLCAPGSIREQYKIEIRNGFARAREGNFPRNIVRYGEVNIGALIDYVTDKCRSLPDDCCIPLANIELRDSGSEWEPEVDIHVRPIVYTNRLLFQLISSLVRREEGEEESETEADV